jgi:hypothetical protein
MGLWTLFENWDEYILCLKPVTPSLHLEALPVYKKIHFPNRNGTGAKMPIFNEESKNG